MKQAHWLAGANDATKALLKLTETPGVISFAGGLPAPEIFPGEAVAAAFRAVIEAQPARALQYGPAEGVDLLREHVAARLCADGAKVGPENVLITTGSQQGLVLLGQVLLDAGNAIAIEEPTFLGALDAWRPREPSYTQVTWQGDLPAITGAPRFVYCLPNFRNPTGETLSEPRRRALAAAAAGTDMVILEDNPYGALRYDGEALPPVLAAASAGGAGSYDDPYDGPVVYMGTVSKTLAPALRVGWMVAPARLMPALVMAKQGLDLCTSPLAQFAACHLAETGVEAATAEAACALYQSRRDSMLDALERRMPDGVAWTRPDGGMFVWVTLPQAVDSERLFERAAAAGVGIVPGTVFYAMNPTRNTIRLNFTNADEADIPTGVDRLAAAIEGLLREAA